MKERFAILKRPIISEKCSALAEVGGKYAFEVQLSSCKEEIRDAVEALFGVDVRSVRTLVMPGKTKRFARSTVKRASWKKAIVTVGDGQKIDFFKMS
jgi:large subunit ribosomal protein L23